MSKQIWVKVIPWAVEAAQAAVESGADALWVEAGVPAQVKKVGLIPTIAEDGDLVLGRDVIIKEVLNKKDEEEIVALSRSKKVIVQGREWTIIPLENLLSRTGNLFIEVTDVQEGQTALAILEKGVDGIVLTNSDPGAIRRILGALKRENEKFELFPARIKRLEPLGLGDRVCVDTCSMMGPGEGMLVGNSSQALFLVHAETVENPFVDPRPFRVNAGAVHAYLRLAGGKTKYLAEVRAGDQALVVNFEGKSYPAVVGRAKVEKRPLVLVEAEKEGRIFSTILQNAETIRLTGPDGKPLSLVDLKKGDEVLVYRENAGRHFGVKIDESIAEQ